FPSFSAKLERGRSDRPGGTGWQVPPVVFWHIGRVGLALRRASHCERPRRGRKIRGRGALHFGTKSRGWRMRGRKPKPTRLKEMLGNPGKRALSTGEPVPEAAIPSCPRFLDKEARKEWRRAAPELYALGVLTNLDRAALAAYCESWSRVAK